MLEDGAIDDGDLETGDRPDAQPERDRDTIERARHFGAVARDALAPFPDSAHKSALIEAVDFCIGRVN